MNRKYLLISVAILLIVAVSVFTIPQIEKGLASRAATESTDSVAGSQFVIVTSEDDMADTVMTYTWSEDAGRYSLTNNVRTIEGTIQVGTGDEGDSADLHSSVRFQKQGTWALVESITVDLRSGNTQLSTITLYDSTNQSDTAGSAGNLGSVSTGSYRFTMTIVYKAHIIMDPAGIQGKYMGPNVTFYLEKKYVTVKFSSVDGSQGQMDDQYITKMESNLNKNQFTREGYAFAGWSVDNSDVVSYSDGSVINVKELIAQDITTLNLKAQWIADGTYSGNTLYATSTKVLKDVTGGITPGHVYYVGTDSSTVITSNSETDTEPILILLRQGAVVDINYPVGTVTRSALVCLSCVEAVVGDSYVMCNGLGSKWIQNGQLTIPERELNVSASSEWGEGVFEPFRTKGDNGQTTSLIADVSESGTTIKLNKNVVFSGSSYSLTGVWQTVSTINGNTVTLTLTNFTGTVTSGPNTLSLTSFDGTIVMIGNGELSVTSYTSGQAIVEKGNVNAPVALVMDYAVTFTVTEKDKPTVPITGVSITLGGDLKTTDSSGRAVFKVHGEKAISIVKEGHTLVSKTESEQNIGDTIYVSAVHDISVVLEPTDRYYNTAEKTLYVKESETFVKYTVGNLDAGKAYYFASNASVNITNTSGERGAPILVLMEDRITVHVTYPTGAANGNTVSVCFYSVKKSAGTDLYTFANGLGTNWYDNESKLLKTPTAGDVGEYHSLNDVVQAQWGEWVYEPYKANGNENQTVEIYASRTFGAVNNGATQDLLFSRSSYNLTGIWARIGAYEGRDVTFELNGFSGTISSGAGGNTLPEKDEIRLSNFIGTVRVIGGTSVSITSWTSGSALVDIGSLTINDSLALAHDLGVSWTFTVKNNEQSPIPGATVAIGAVHGDTNPSGIVKLSVSFGSGRSLTVVKDGYAELQEQVDVTSSANSKDVVLQTS